LAKDDEDKKQISIDIKINWDAVLLYKNLKQERLNKLTQHRGYNRKTIPADEWGQSGKPTFKTSTKEQYEKRHNA
jgi:hypothetical protein